MTLREQGRLGGGEGGAHGGGYAGLGRLSRGGIFGIRWFFIRVVSAVFIGGGVEVGRIDGLSCRGDIRSGARELDGVQS